MLSIARFATLLVLIGCAPLVSAYDPVFDQSLNGFSEDTAIFIASAMAGGQERLVSSQEAVQYYAGAYNVLDRLSARARLTRGPVACPDDSKLDDFWTLPFVTSELPEDHMEFDCREFQLYGVRLNLDDLKHGQQTDGVLRPLEAKALGGKLQVAIIGAINTFVVSKPKG